jgi:hypothetical protein
LTNKLILTKNIELVLAPLLKEGGKMEEKKGCKECYSSSDFCDSCNGSLSQPPQEKTNENQKRVH